MEILSWIILGGLAGWIASMFTGRNAEMGILANIIVGIIGAVIGGFVAGLFGAQGATGFNLYSFFIALIGSIILLALVNLFTRKKTHA